MDRTFKYLPNHGLKGKVAAPVLALRRVGAASTRNSLCGFFMSHGMVVLRGSIGYGRAPGDVKTGVAGTQELTAIDEARATGEDVVAMLRQLGRK